MNTIKHFLPGGQRMEFLAENCEVKHWPPHKSYQRKVSDNSFTQLPVSVGTTCEENIIWEKYENIDQPEEYYHAFDL